MLRSLSKEDAQEIRSFLKASNFTREGSYRQLEITELPSKRPDQQPYLEYRTRDATPLNSLLRLFFLGLPVSRAQAEPSIPARAMRALLETGLVRESGNELVSDVSLTPFGPLWVVADPVGSGPEDLVIWPNPTTLMLWQFTIRRRVQAVLDVGTGCGVQALMAASHAESVLATDLNPRAITFTRFSAWLNGIENVECAVGDTYEPAGDRKFDLIVSNPPFFVTPGNRKMYCENPLELDEFCRRVVREGARRLNPGGMLQIVCEWVQKEGENWPDRVSEWVNGVEGSAWIVKGYTEPVASYARKRMRETEAGEVSYGEWMGYYSDRKVAAVHGGMVALKRNPPPNWVRIEECGSMPQGEFGQTVERVFDTLDWIVSRGPQWTPMDWRPKLAGEVRMDEGFEPGEGRWQPVSCRLRLTGGLPLTIQLQPAVAEFIGKCDGKRTFGDLVQELSASVNAPPDRVAQECWSVLRRLLEAGFLCP